MIFQPMTPDEKRPWTFWGAMRDSPIHFLTVLELFTSVLLENLGLVIPRELCCEPGKKDRVMRFLYPHAGLEEDSDVSKPSNF